MRTLLAVLAVLVFATSAHAQSTVEFCWPLQTITANGFYPSAAGWDTHGYHDFTFQFDLTSGTMDISLEWRLRDMTGFFNAGTSSDDVGLGLTGTISVMRFEVANFSSASGTAQLCASR